MGFMQTLKELKWDLTSHRFQYWQAFYGMMPSYLGHRLRQRLYRKYFKRVGEGCKFHEGVFIRNPRLFSIGDRCHLGVGCRIQAGGGLTFGDNVVLGPGVSIWTQNHVFADPDTPIREQPQESKAVSIGDDVWIGANAFVMPGADIPKGCVISAGAVVGGKRYKEFSILAGNPARVIGFRKQPPKPAEKPADEPAAAAGSKESSSPSGAGDKSKS